MTEHATENATQAGPLTGRTAFSGFGVGDLEAARAFYAETLGVTLDLSSLANGMFTLDLGTGAHVLLYARPGHEPAAYTVLNFQVPDIEATVDALTARGVVFERYEGMGQDERGINRRGGPLVAWFTDPSGNILSVIQD